jgi:hypothetical protein
VAEEPIQLAHEEGELHPSNRKPRYLVNKKLTVVLNAVAGMLLA